jgi:hypothetical protein
MLPDSRMAALKTHTKYSVARNWAGCNVDAVCAFGPCGLRCESERREVCFRSSTPGAQARTAASKMRNRTPASTAGSNNIQYMVQGQRGMVFGTPSDIFLVTIGVDAGVGPTATGADLKMAA